MPVQLWVGHLRDKPDEWFMVWAPDESEAMRYAMATVGEPEPGTLEQVEDAAGISVRFAPDIVPAVPGGRAHYRATKFIPNVRVEQQIQATRERIRPPPAR